MSTFVVLEFQAKPDKVEAVNELLRQVLPDTRNYAGVREPRPAPEPGRPCIDDDVRAVVDSPPLRGYEAYLAWRTDTGALPEFTEMLAGPPSLRFFDLVDA